MSAKLPPPDDLWAMIPPAAQARQVGNRNALRPSSPRTIARTTFSVALPRGARPAADVSFGKSADLAERA